MATRKSAQATKSQAEFGERMSIEEFLKDTGAKSFDVYPRKDKKGYYYFATEKTLGYVPKELGAKIENGGKYGRLFIAKAKTPGYDEPMFMLCESKRESLLHFSLD